MGPRLISSVGQRVMDSLVGFDLYNFDGWFSILSLIAFKREGRKYENICKNSNHPPLADSDPLCVCVCFVFVPVELTDT